MCLQVTSSTTNVVPLPRKERVESEEWRVELTTASEARFSISGIRIHPDLIHRKRSPFSYKEKTLGRSAWGIVFFHIAASEALPRRRIFEGSPQFGRRLSLLLVGEGGPLAVDEVWMDKRAHSCKSRSRKLNPASEALTRCRSEDGCFLLRAR